MTSRNSDAATFAVLLDIDGVLLRDNKPIARASESMKRLTERSVPCVVVSNGGGWPEWYRAKQLSELLGVCVPESHMILAHTPMRDLPSGFLQRPLVVGRARAREVALSIGVKEPVLLQDFARARPFLFPQKEYEPLSDGGLQRCCDGPLSCVLVLEAPEDWGEALGDVIDVLTTSEGRVPLSPAEHPEIVGEGQSLPVFVANPDFTYGGGYSVPRLTVGAFMVCLKELFSRVTGRELQATVFGKPDAGTYEYVRDLLKREGHSSIRTLYAVGDNPPSDVRGINNLAKTDSSVSWKSVLVRTGCFSRTLPNDPDDPADYVVEDIAEAVEKIFDSEDLRT